MTHKTNSRRSAIYTISFIFAFFAGVFNTSATQISGTVTVDPNGTAGTTVFKDINSLVTYITTANARTDGGPANAAPFGVNGALIVDIAAGTYIEQIDIPAITGASFTNTVTFKGASKTTTIVSCTTATTSLRHTIRINSATWIILRDMTIRAGTSTFGWPVHLMGSTNNSRVANCNIDFGSTALSSQTSDNHAAVVMNNSVNTLSTAGTFNNIDIDSNFIYGGQHSIWASGTAASSIMIRVRNNNADSANRYGFYFSGIGELKCLDNLIENRYASTSVSDGTGIYLSASNAAATKNHEIARNRITNAERYGVYWNNSSGVASPRSVFHNNAITGGFRSTDPYGIYIGPYSTSAYNWDIYFNTVILDNVATGSQSACFYQGMCCTQDATRQKILNNIFAVTNPLSSSLLFYTLNGMTYVVATTSDINNNTFFKQGAGATTAIMYVGGTLFNSTNYVSSSGGYFNNCRTTNPQFVSATNLALLTPCSNGQAISGYTTDINGNTRAATPDVGAYEYQASPNDAGVTAIVGPAAPFTAGAQNVVLTLSNFGSTNLTSTNISYSVNGVTPVNKAWTGNLAQCATANVTFSGGDAYTFATATSYAIKGFTTSPNGASDGNALNDTATLSGVGTALSGNYTIDAGSPASATNFQSFSAAASALNSGGVNGPVYITVVGSTPYVEQVSFSAIPGASAVNTITIDGGSGNAASRILSFNFPVTPSNYAVMRLDGTDYMRIKNLTIRSTSATYGYGVLFTNQANYNIIDSCIVDLSTITSTSSANSAGICFSGASNNTSTAANNGSYNIIRNNEIKGAASGGPYRGVSLYGNTSGFDGSNVNNEFLNNVITNFYAEGIYLYYYLNNLVIKGNSISRPNRTGGTTIFGIRMEQYMQNAVVDGNKVFNPFGGQLTSGNAFYGISLQYCYNIGNNTIRNNAIYNINGMGQHYGIYSYYNYGGTYYYNNTISFDFATAKTNTNSDHGINIYMGSNGVHDLKNNIITLRRSGSTVAAQRYGIYFQDYFTGTVSNNNLILAAAATATNYAVRYNNLDYPSLAAWKASNSNAFDQASVAFDPLYTNLASDVTPTSCGINNLGVSVSGVTMDITGTTRGAIPDIGAYEFSVSPSVNNAALTGFDATTTAMCAGGINAVVVLKNEGTANISSAKIDWAVNGTPQTQYSWSGTLAPGASTNVTIGTATFTANSTNSISAYTSEVNGTTDGCLFNDTASLSGTSAMSGAYTINASGSGATNYTSFANAITALTTRGVCGPVTFNVAANTYNGQFIIPAIPGASSTNTITFDGTSAAAAILTHVNTGTSTRYTVRLNGSEWIRLKNLTIRSTSTQAWPVHLFNHSSNIQIRNCIIECSNTLTSQTTTNYIPIVINGTSATSVTSQTNSYNIDIDSNTINGGWYGVSFYGNTTAGTNTGINVRNNTFNNNGLYAFYPYYATAPVISNNTINMRVGNGASTVSWALYLEGCQSDVTNGVKIIGNKITAATQYGVYISNSGGSATTQRAQMVNNAIGGGFTNTSSYGVYIASGTHWDVWFNSINIDNAATSASAAFRHAGSGASYMDIRNNNFAITNAGASGALCFMTGSGVTTNSLNYNNYFKQGASGATNIVNVLGTNYTFTNFTTTAGANSISLSPSYTSATNLLPTVGTNNGIQILSLTTDIRDSVRNNPPDIGAYELPSTATLDLGIVSVVLPDTTLPLGSHNVAVKVKNFATTTITGFRLRHSVNSSNIQDTVITGISLAQYDTISVYMGSGKQATFGLAANTFKVYVDNVNSTTDDNQVNDSISIGPRWPALSGVFTINPSGSGLSNFTSFTSAVAALNNGGVSGAVTLNVSSNTFNEQITINSISGASATKAIRFVGNGTVSTTLNFAGNSTPNQHTVRLNGSQFISFENMTISGGGTTGNWVVHLFNAANNTIKKCKITIGGAGATSTSTNYAAIVANNSTTSATTSSSAIHNNVIDSNTIESGHYGVVVANSNSACINYFRGNTFTSTYYYAFYLQNSQGFVINDNIINMRSGNINSMGVYTSSATVANPYVSEIKRNKITGAGQYGIYMTSTTGNSSGVLGEISNNMVGGGFTNTSSGYGIFLNSSSYWRVWHNTVNYDGTGTSSGLFVQNGNNIDVRNNIFAITNAAATLALPVYIIPTTAVSTFDYNNFYSASSASLANLAGNIFNTSTFRTAAYPTAAGLFSTNKNPAFTSSTNLHINEACMNGTNLGITTDIDGNTRAGVPDMGADEMTSVPALDASIMKINVPVFPYSSGSQPINVTYQNNGSSTLTALTIGYTVNGGTAVTETLTGLSVAPCDTVNFTFSANFNFGVGPNVLKVFTSAPNSGTDANTANDTVTSSPFCVGMSGTYTINPAGSGPANYTSFSAAVAALNCGGLSGSVVFNVANGIYNEQISISPVNGASAANTITFQSASGNPANVTLSNAPSTGNYVVSLDGADYVTFNKITLTNNNSANGLYNVLLLANGANFNTIRGCSLSNANPTQGNLIFSSATSDHNNTIVSNVFTGASYGIYWQSSTSSVANYALNNVIDSNTFTNQYNYAIYLYYHNQHKIRYNQITSSSATTFYGISSQYCYQAPVITNNMIVVNNTTNQAYGMQLNGLNNSNTASPKGLVANNMVKVGAGTGASYGIQVDQYAYYTDFLHNTVSVTPTTGIGFAMHINQGTPGYNTDNCTFANNIFQSTSTSTSSFAFWHNSTNLTGVVIDNNNYFVAAGNVGRQQGTNRATLAAWKSGNPTYNINSTDKSAEFVSSTDLHLSGPCLDNTGSNAYNSQVPDDIDGQTRSSSNPDVGADEFNANASDFLVRRITAPTAYNASPQTVTVKVVNNGSATVNSVVLGYSINGGTTVSQTFTGLTLASCDSTDLSFSTQVSIPTGLSVLRAFVNGNINSSADANSANDTALASFCTPLAGTFTIDAGIPVSSTNFQSFTAAISALTSCGGVSGAVTFNVAKGTFTEQISLGAVAGISASNTVSFVGAGIDSTILTFESSNTSARHTLLLNAASYITFKSLTIRGGGSGSFAWPVHLLSSANNNIIRNCKIEITGTGATSSSTNFSSVVINNSATSPTSQGTANNNTVDSCTIISGYYGIMSAVSSGTNINYYNRNTISNSYYCGVYLTGAQTPKINNNSISIRTTSGTTSSVGIYLTSAISGGTNVSEITGNKITNTGQYGIFITSSSAVAAARGKLVNNSIGGGFTNTNDVAGIYFSGSSYNWDVYFNSVNIDVANGGTNSAAMYLGNCCTQGSTLLDVRNNLLAVTNASSSSYLLYLPNGYSYAYSSTGSADYNLFYRAGSSSANFIYDGGNLLTSTNYSGWNGYYNNCKVANPNFASSFNLTPGNPCNKGAAISGITTDINGVTRNTPPDMGAVEILGDTNNAAMVQLVSPTAPFASGSRNLTVEVRNSGSNTITALQVGYIANNGTPVVLNWTGSLSPCATTNVTFSGANALNILAGTSYAIKFYTANPNGQTDPNITNDTVTVSFGSALCGSYTINSGLPASASNFQSFTAAVNALNSSGVSCPVTFNVASGTYNEQVELNTVPGSSSVNTITFDGGTGNAATRTLWFTATTQADAHTFRITNTPGVTIRNLTIQGRGASFGWPVHINGNSSSFTQVKNCRINYNGTTGETAASGNHATVVVNNSKTSIGTNSSASNIQIDSNEITGGYYGVYITGNNSYPMTLRSNAITNVHYQGVYIFYYYGIKVLNNSISMHTSGSASSSGLYITQCFNNGTDSHEIRNNSITNAKQYGMYIYYLQAGTTNRSKITNNMVAGNFVSTSAYGIYVDGYTTYMDMWHNSVNLNVATSSAQYAAISSGVNGNNNWDVRNNVFAYTAASGSGLPAYFGNVTGTFVLDYNDYFNVAATNLLYRANTATTYTNSTFNTLAAGGANSVNVNPAFTSATDLRSTNNTINGIYIPSVSTDIDGRNRLNPPDMGCSEVPLSLDMSATALLSPTNPTSAGTFDLSFRIKNVGVSTVTSATVGYIINGGAAQTTSWTGSLAADDTASVIFTNAFTGVLGSSYIIKVFVVNPNSSADAAPVNDTLITTICPGYSGTYTINAAGSGPNNFTSFASAISAISSCAGVAGPLTFNVAANTYNEQVSVPAINGASATNTIRFIGVGQANTIINNSSTGHTVRLNGSQYITFENVTIRANGTSSTWPVLIANAQNNTIKNCKIEFAGSAATSTNSNLIAVAISGSATNATTASTTATNNYIDSCTIVAGYTAIQSYVNNGMLKNYFRWNTINSPWYYGVFTQNNQAIEFIGNTVNMRNGNVNSVGIYVGSSATSPSIHNISSNKIIGSGTSGVQLYGNGSSSGLTPGTFINNMIGGGFTNTTVYGMQVSSSNWRMWHNTVIIDNVPTASSYAYYHTGGNNNDTRNNVFSVTDASATIAQPVFIQTASVVNPFNYNNLYNAAGTNLITVGSNTFTTGNYKANYPSGAGVNSTAFNPNTISSTDLHIGEACMNGTDLGITVDIEGHTRGSVPDMGADEMNTIPSLDASVLKINTPTNPYSIGSQTVNVTLQNNGSAPINSLVVAYSVNGGTAVVQNISDTVQPCDTLNFSFTTPYNFGAGPNVLKVYVYSPNGGNDANLINDTITTSPFCVPMSGTYTINQSGSGATNYVSFAAAISALQCGGVNGPVVFNVSNGTYNEQVNLVPVSGASAINTITFQSATGVASNVIVSSTPGAENYVLNFNGADYMRIHNITITNPATSTGYYNVVQFTGSADNNELRGCVISNSTPTSGNLVSVSNTKNFYNKIAGNTFNGGSAGVLWQSNTSSPYASRVEIDSNTFNNQYNYAVYVYYTDSVRIRGNTISTNVANTNYYGIYATGTFVNNIVTYNKITGFLGGNGIYLNSFGNNGSPTNRSLIANNFIQGGSGANNAYGIYCSYVIYTDFLHNSVNLTSATGTAMALYSNSTLQNNIFANNIFQSMSAGTGSYAFNSSSSFSSNTINFNNYFVAAGNIGYLSSSNQASLANWKTATGQDVNSVNLRADFTSSTDLHLNSPCLDNTGTNAYNSLAGVDIDGQTRSVTTPDMGADEFSTSAFDIQVSTITAPTTYSGSPQNVSVRIVNRGSTTITSVVLGYNVNDGAVTSQTFTGLTLAPCDSIVRTFSAQVSLPGGLSVLKVFVNGQLNGSNNDASAANDTANVSFCNSLAGTFTINNAASVSATNFTSFASAIAAMRSCGLGGAVTFNVAAGTYNEQVNIVNIPGVSAMNSVTFNGTDSATTIVQFNATNTNARHVVMIDSCKHITFRNFKIVNTGSSFAWGIHLRGNASAPTDSVRIARCSVVIPFNTGTNFNGIVLSNSLTSPTTQGSYCSAITLDSNTTYGGYYGLSYFGVSTSVRNSGATIRGNKFMNSYWGNRLDFLNGPVITGNISENNGKQTSTNTNAYSFYFNSCDSVKVTRNQIYGAAGGYSIYFTSVNGTSGAENQIVNNMIQLGEGNVTANAIYISSAPFTNIYYNSINITATSTSTSAASITVWTSSNNTNIVNNNLVATGSTSPYLVYYPFGGVSLSDYNNYYGQGSQLFNGSSTLAGFKGTLHSGSDNNSRNVVPAFVSNTNLRMPSNIDLDSSGTVIPSVTIDLEGNTRNSVKPDIGCFEYAPPTENTGAIAIVNPVNPVSAGLQEVHVVIKNFGPTTITSDSVVYTDGAVTHKILWTGSLVTNATDTVRFTSTSGPGSTDQRYNFSGNVTLTAYTIYPNGIMDGFNSNDTVQTNFCGGMSGTYTINPSGSGPTNFTSFTAAVNQLTCGGVSGPVVFNISNGVYNEQISIGSIIGASSTNTIKFQSASGVAANVTLQAIGTVSNNYTIRFMGADYVTIDKITMTNPSSSYGRVVEFAANGSDNSTNNSITNSVLTGPSVTSSSDVYAVIYSNNVADSNTTITGNIINRGAYGIYWFGNSGNYTRDLLINGNTFGSTTALANYSRGVELVYTMAPQVISNQFIAPASSTGHMSLRVSNSNGSGRINKNRITANGSTRGISLQSINVGQTTGFDVINNASFNQ
jgi:hypothetical protein